MVSQGHEPGHRMPAIRNSIRPLAAALAAGALVLAGAIALGGGEAEAGRAKKVVATDVGKPRSPIRFWEEIECVRNKRHRWMRRGGDFHRTGAGWRQRNRSYRRLVVFDGDDFWGERCELGNNSLRSRTAFYREGMRRITYISIRLPRRFPLGTRLFQSVVQMKQAGPADNSGGTPVIDLHAFKGRWRLRQSASPGPSDTIRELWTRPARKGRWTRFRFDVLYSKLPSKGFIRLWVDLNADGDFADRGERSPTFRTYTLKVETAGTSSDGVAAGSSLPSHLRAGIYHDSRIRCRRGCPVHIDNVQVMRP